MNEWYEYVVETAGTASQTQIAADTGIGQSTLAKWKKGIKPSPAQVAKFATEMKRQGRKIEVLDAFVVAEFLTPEQAGVRPTATPRLSAVSEGQLVAEVAKRLGVEVEVQPPAKKAARKVHVADEDPGQTASAKRRARSRR